MIKRIKKFVGLSWCEQWLYIEAFCLSGVVRLAILLVPFRWLALPLGKHMRESPMKEEDAKLATAIRIGRVIETMSHYTPWESKCLVQAIVGKIMLRQRGIKNTLYLGLGRDGKKNLIAHAWVRCGEMIITGGRSLELYAIVGKFADDGGHEETMGVK